MTLKQNLTTKEGVKGPEEQLREALEELIPGAQLEWQEVAGLQALLIEEDSGSRPLPSDSVDAVMDSPPFWSLLWPSGEKLCRVLVNCPQLVEGRTVLDFGAGCGLLAVASSLAQSASVVAADCDALSQLAVRANATQNNAPIQVVGRWESQPVDTVLLADLLYDESNLELLALLSAQANEVVVVDSRLSELHEDGFVFLGSGEGIAVPDLDPHREFGRLKYWYKGPRGELWGECLGPLER